MSEVHPIAVPTLPPCGVSWSSVRRGPDPPGSPRFSPPLRAPCASTSPTTTGSWLWPWSPSRASDGTPSSPSTPRRRSTTLCGRTSGPIRRPPECARCCAARSPPWRRGSIASRRSTSSSPSSTDSRPGVRPWWPASCRRRHDRPASRSVSCRSSSRSTARRPPSSSHRGPTRPSSWSAAGLRAAPRTPGVELRRPHAHPRSRRRATSRVDGGPARRPVR